VQRIDAACTAGIGSDRIAIDPGIGFGKTVEHNLQLIAGLGRFAALGYPVLLGVSRKSFLATAAQSQNVEDRDVPTAVLTTEGFRLGARIFRVHAARPNAQALRLAESLSSCGNSAPQL
jgi:dihydropteroate synthase